MATPEVPSEKVETERPTPNAKERADKGIDVIEAATRERAAAFAVQENIERTEVLRRKNEVIAVPDIHGDPIALGLSLEQAGCIRIEGARWVLMDKVKNERVRIVLTGDLNDRGDDTLGVYDRIIELKLQGATMDILAGNHDLFMIDALQTGNEQSVRIWYANGGLKVLDEISDKCGLTEYPKPKTRWQRLQEWLSGEYAYDPRPKRDADQSTAKARELFFSEGGRYAEIFNNVHIAVQHDDVLYVHAGVDDTWAEIMEREGVEGANAFFRSLWKEKRLQEMAEKRGRYAGIVWLRESEHTPAMTEKRARILAKKGIRYVVHGHDKLRAGGQQVQEYDYGDVKITVINTDIGMSSGYRSSGTSGYGYLRAERNGNINAESSKAAKVEIAWED